MTMTACPREGVRGKAFAGGLAPRASQTRRLCRLARRGFAAFPTTVPLAAMLLFVALVANADDVIEPDGFWTGPINSPVPASLAGGELIHAQELAELLKQNDALVIDVSNAPQKPEGMAPDAPWLPLPHEAIPASAWIPGAGMGDISPDIDEYFRAYLARATQSNLDYPVVIYCHEHCWLSWNAAKRAILYGYRRIHWFPEGVEGWRAAGFRTAVARPIGPADARGKR